MPPTEGPPSRDEGNEERLTLAEAGAKPYDWNRDDPDLTDEKPYDQATNTGGKPISTEPSQGQGIAQVTSIEEYRDRKKEADSNGPKPPPGPRGGTKLSA